MVQALHHRIVEVSTFDASRLRLLIMYASTLGKGRVLWLSRLHRILNAARLVLPHDMHPDTVTMNSTAGLRDNRGKTMKLTLVFPESASRGQGAKKRPNQCFDPYAAWVIGIRAPYRRLSLRPNLD